MHTIMEHTSISLETNILARICFGGITCIYSLFEVHEYFEHVYSILLEEHNWIVFAVDVVIITSFMYMLI